MKIQTILTALVLIILPFSGVGAAVSSTSYQINPSDNTISTTHNLSSTSYQLNGAIESLTGRQTSTSYDIDSGSSLLYFCGDGFVDPGEDCDTGSYGTNMNEKTCQRVGFDGGTLSCTSSCIFDTSACTTDEGGGGGGGGGGGSFRSTTSSTPSAPTVSNDFGDDYFTYQDSLDIYGTIDSNTTSVEVNGQAAEITSTSWEREVNLEVGDNTFEIIAENSSGTQSSVTEITVHRRAKADINDDGSVNDYDLSMLIQLWLTSDQDGDFNADGSVDDYDFSILVSRWG